jgi:Pyrimidine dimer DNA glycosylase
VQTFLPYTSTIACAQGLDNKRLNKQILEGYQILNILSGKSKGGAWRNHPAVLMWKGFERGLWTYIEAMVQIANLRGIKTENNVRNLKALHDQCWETWGDKRPEFWNDETKVMRIVTTHRANLFNKDPMYYAKYQSAVNSPYNSPCCPDRKEPCKYYWPTHEEKNVLV